MNTTNVMLQRQLDRKVKELRAFWEPIANAMADDGTEPTDEQREQFDTMQDDIDKLREKLADRHRANVGSTLDRRNGNGHIARWVNAQTGEEVPVLRPDQRMADVRERDPKLPPSDELDFGRFLLGAITGEWAGREAEKYLASMSTSVNTAGGVMVPSQLWDQVIDLARAESVLIRAGARTLPMTTDRMTIAKVTADPTIEVKAENAAFSEADPTFTSVGFTATTIGCLVRMSRELAADAPNAAELLTQVLTRALATKVDYYGLRGSGSAEPLGLINFADVNTVNAGGTLTYAHVLTGIMECEKDNAIPNAYVLSPTNKNSLAAALINAEANHFAPPPVDVADLDRYVTTNLPDTDAIVGKFESFLIGMRQNAQVEISTEENESFEKHQLALKITTRLAFNTERDTDFAVIGSIS